jgi:hypothetical protein
VIVGVFFGDDRSQQYLVLDRDAPRSEGFLMIFGFLFVKIIIMAIVLRSLLRFVAKHEADLSWDKILMVAAAINLAAFCVEHFSKGMDPRYVFAAKLAVVVILIMTFLWTSLIRTLIVIGLYAALQFALGHGVELVLKRIVPTEKRELLKKEVRRERVKGAVDRVKNKADQRRKIKLPETHN